MKQFIAVLVIVSLFFSSCGDSPKAKESKTIEQVKMVCDIAPLLNKSIDDIAVILGKPTDWTEPTKLQMNSGFDTWDNTFKLPNLDIMVTYNPQTRKVKDIFLPTSESNGTSDYSSLLQKGNLSESNQSYNIKPVIMARDKSKYTGIIVSLVE